MKNECFIVRDLLPLVEEKLASAETSEFVKEHIAGCKSCRDERDKLRADDPAEIDMEYPAEEAAANLKKLKIKLNVRKVIIGIASSLVTIAVLAGLSYFLLIGGYAAERDDFEIYTEFVSVDDTAFDAYLDQEFVIRINRIDGKPLWIDSDYTYETDANGNDVCVKTVYTIKETPISLVPNPSGFTAGFSYPSDSTPADDLDQVVIFRFADGEKVVFSMRDEGLYEPQEDISTESKYIWVNGDLMTKEEYYEYAKEYCERAERIYEDAK